MQTNRLEAFSDGVLAIIITIMVLELKVPKGAELSTLIPILPIFLGYVLSFIYVGIYWNNHHHLLHTCKHVTGGVLWANLHLLFWLSLFPVSTAWLGQNPYAPIPTSIYGVMLLGAAIAYYILQLRIIANQGRHSILKQALGSDWKGKLSPLCYLVAIPLAFVYPLASDAIYVALAFVWLIPDRRIERALASRH